MHLTAGGAAAGVGRRVDRVARPLSGRDWGVWRGAAEGGTGAGTVRRGGDERGRAKSHSDGMTWVILPTCDYWYTVAIDLSIRLYLFIIAAQRFRHTSMG